MWGPAQNLGPIGSAVLTFIGYKRTDKQTNRQVLIFHDVILHHPNCWMICTGTCTAVLVHAGLVDPACCMHNIWTGCIDYMMCFYFQIYSQREDWYWLGTRRFRFCYFYLGKGITQIFHWCENVEGFHIYTGLPNPQRMRLYFDDFKVK